MVVTLTDACELLEHNPYDKWRELMIRIDCNLQNLHIHVLFLDELYSDDVEVKDDMFPIDQWARFGRAVGHNECFDGICICFKKKRHGNQVIDLEYMQPMMRCINAFMEGAKHNKSILRAKFDMKGLAFINAVSHFIGHNWELKSLILSTRILNLRFMIPLEPSTNLSQAIRSAPKLESLNIEHCQFSHTTSFQQMLSGCATVPRLSLSCEQQSHAQAVGAFLLDSENATRELKMTHLFHLTEGHMRAIRRESDSSERFFISSACGFDIYKLLGDVSSIKSLTDSNHTLQHVRLQASHFISTTGRISLDRVSLDLPPFAKKCLELNRIDNKLRVIRNKITQLYFVGDFDVTPFRHMPISVLPEVISQIKCSTQQSAIFRLLVSVPELFIPFKRGLAKQTKPPISLI